MRAIKTAGLAAGAGLLGAIGWFLWPSVSEGRKIPVSIVRLIHIAIVLWALFAMGHWIVGEFSTPQKPKALRVANAAMAKAVAADQLNLTLVGQRDSARLMEAGWHAAFDKMMKQRDDALTEARLVQGADEDAAKQCNAALKKARQKEQQIPEVGKISSCYDNKTGVTSPATLDGKCPWELAQLSREPQAVTHVAPESADDKLADRIAATNVARKKWCDRIHGHLEAAWCRDWTGNLNALPADLR